MIQAVEPEPTRTPSVEETSHSSQSSKQHQETLESSLQVPLKDEVITSAQANDAWKSMLRENSHASKIHPLQYSQSATEAETLIDVTPSAIPLARSEEFLKNQLRQLHIDTRPRNTITRPESPRFTPIHQRELPKSSSQKEEELMEYYRSHPFKALDAPAESRQSPSVKSPAMARTPTQARPFHFESDKRGANRHHLMHYKEFKTKEQADWKECQNQFRALPLPGTEISPRVYQPHSCRSHGDTETSEEASKPFRARPLPKSTYSPKLAPKTTTASSSNSHKGPKERTTFGAHKTNLPSVKVASSKKDIKPFQLKSLERHEQRKQQLAEERRQAELQEQEQRTFRARPLPQTTIQPLGRKSPRVTPRKLPHANLQPFSLASVRRAEAHKAQLDEERMLKEDEERQQRVFRARPMPHH